MAAITTVLLGHLSKPPGAVSDESDHASVAWLFGGDGNKVVGGVSQDGAGNLYLMSVRASVAERHEGVSLVVLDGSGREIRRSLVVPGGRLSPANPWNRWALRAPIVDDAGSAWVLLAQEVVRLGERGEIRWRVPLPQSLPEGSTHQRFDFGGALDQEGTLFLTTPTFLTAVSATGKVRWNVVRGVKPGLNRALADVGGGAPALGKGGLVYASCIGCFPGRPSECGVAAFDARTGIAKWLVGEKVGDPRFGSPAIGRDGTVYVPAAFGLQATVMLAATPGGRPRWPSAATFGFGDPRVTPTVGTNDLMVFANGPRLWLVNAKTRQGKEIDVGGEVLSVVLTKTAIWTTVRAPGLDASQGELVVLDFSGRGVERLSVPRLATAMNFTTGNGMVYAITAEGRLIAVADPRASRPAGAWPGFGGDPGNRRSSQRR